MGIKKQQESTTVIDSDIQLGKPRQYRVLMHNDDYTTTDFVVEILQTVFQKSYEEAHHIMLAIHHKGIGTCGIYSYEVAETKVLIVDNRAESQGFPLKCTIEEE